MKATLAMKKKIKKCMVALDDCYSIDLFCHTDNLEERMGELLRFAGGNANDEEWCNAMRTAWKRFFS